MTAEQRNRYQVTLAGKAIIESLTKQAAGRRSIGAQAQRNLRHYDRIMRRETRLAVAALNLQNDGASALAHALDGVTDVAEINDTLMIAASAYLGYDDLKRDMMSLTTTQKEAVLLAVERVVSGTSLAEAFGLPEEAP